MLPIYKLKKYTNIKRIKLKEAEEIRKRLITTKNKINQYKLYNVVCNMLCKLLWEGPNVAEMSCLLASDARVI